MPKRGGDIGIGALLPQLLAQLSLDSGRSSEALRQYCGAYAVYFCTPVWSSHIVRSLTIFGQDGPNIFTKSIERMEVRPKARGRRPVQKFRARRSTSSIAFIFSNMRWARRFRGADHPLSLAPPQRHYLTGIILTVASAGNRQPFASRVVYEYLGEDVDFRARIVAEPSLSHGQSGHPRRDPQPDRPYRR